MLLTNTPSLFFDFGSRPLPNPPCFCTTLRHFCKNHCFSKRSRFRLLATLPSLFPTFWLPNPPFWGTPLGHLRSSFWSNPPAVLLNSHFHNLCKSLILNNTPTLSATLCYWPFALEVDFEATLYQFCQNMILTSSHTNVILKNPPSLFATLCYWQSPWEVYFWTTVHQICRIMFSTTSRGSVVLNNTPSLFVTLRWQLLPREVYFWITLHKFCIKINICAHLWKCIFEQHSVTLRMLTSNHPGQIGLWLFWRPTVSQSRRVDNKIS